MQTLINHLRAQTDLDAFGIKVGIAPSRLGQILNGDDPSLGELRRIADGLRLPIAALVTEPEKADETRLLFRRAGASGHPLEMSAVENLSSKLDASRLFLGDQRPSYSLAWKREFVGDGVSLDAAAENAAIFRRVFLNDDQMGPINSLPRIVSERMGVILFATRSSDFDGASALIDGVAFAFVSARFKPRMLFTLAHEIGHLIAHHDDKNTFAVVDEDVEASLTSKSLAERYANAFASCLLLPAQGVAISLRKIREVSGASGDQIGDLEINLLSRIYGVSFWAAALRCEALKLIPRGGAAALQEHVRKAHGSAEKRAEAVGLPPRVPVEFPTVPRPLLETAVRKVREGQMTLGRAAALLELSIDELLTENMPVAH